MFEGDWKLNVSTPMGEQDYVLVVKSQDGDTFEGLMEVPMGPQEFQGSIDGNHLQWSIKMSGRMPIRLDFDIAITGDAVTGTVKLGAMASAPVTGTRA